MTAPNKMAKRAAAGTLALAICFTGGVLGAGAANAAAGFKFDTRISGADRTATSVAAAEAAFGKGSDTVIIVERDAVVDGLTASYAAGLNKAPILYVDRQGVPDNVATEIKKLGATKAILVGGKAVLPQAVEDQLKSANLSVTRQSGPDRYATAAAVALAGPRTPDKVLVASGEVPADALAAGPVAYAKNYPLVLVRPDSVPDSSRDALDKLGSGERLAIGGTVRISASVYDSLGQSKRRVSGANRQLTAIEIAKIATGELGFAKDRVALVSDADRAAVDALVASPVAGSNLAPLLFISGSNLGADTTKYLQDNAAALTGPGYIFGGTAAVPQSVADSATSAAGGNATAPPPVTSNQAYSVNPTGPSIKTVSTGDDNKGFITYSVTGLPADGKVNIALFDTTGTNAPTVDAAGNVTFKSAAGDATAGNAAGALTDGGGTYIASVNGVPTSASTKPAKQTNINTTGSLTFVVNSTVVGSVVPVVYTAPANAGTNPSLGVDAKGAPQSGFAVGVGGVTTWNGAEAPAAAAAGGYSDVTVVSVDAANKTFQGRVTSTVDTDLTRQGNTYTFTYAAAGTTYTDSADKPLSATDFAAELSGTDANAVLPNSTTDAPVAGDTVSIGVVRGYATDSATDIKLLTDVPAAPVSVSASYNATAINNTDPGVVVTWAAPSNADVVSYDVFRSQVKADGTLAAAVKANVAPITTQKSGTVNNQTTTLAGSPEYIDTTATSGFSYVYYVRAVKGAAGAFSTKSNNVQVGAGIEAPTVKSVVIVPSTAGATDPNTGATTGGTAGQAIVTFDEDVSGLKPVAADFTYSNTGGTGVLAGVPATSVQDLGKTLVITYPQSYVASVAGNGDKTYAELVVAAPSNGDAFSYKAPANPTTANSVYAGTTANPLYAKDQALASNGQANSGNTISNPVVQAADAPILATPTQAGGPGKAVTGAITAPVNANGVAVNGYRVTATKGSVSKVVDTTTTSYTFAAGVLDAGTWSFTAQVISGGNSVGSAPSAAETFSVQ